MIIPKPLATGTGTGSNDTRTVPNNATWVVSRARFCNTTGSTVHISVVANDGSARQIIAATGVGSPPITAGQTYVSPELVGLTLTQTMSLVLNLPAGVDFWIDGTEFST